MKKITLLAVTAMSVLTLSSCGGDSSEKQSDKKEESVAKTEQATKKQEAKKEENIYVKDKFLKDMNLTATSDKYSQDDWNRISKLAKAYEVFRKENEGKAKTQETYETFFKNQGYKSFDEGKANILEIAKLYKVAIAIPTNFGGLGAIKKLYGEEKYKESLKNTSEEYNKLGFSTNDLKNIEKYSDGIGKVYVLKTSLEYIKK